VINPDYYLGGKMKLKKEKSLVAITSQIAEPLGLDPYEAAAGVVELIDIRMREFMKTMTARKGLTTADYYLLGYGGAGPMHMSGYSRGLPFAGMITVPFAAGFSAFGLSTIDFNYRYQRSCNLFIPPDADDKTKSKVGEEIDSIWAGLEEKAMREMSQEGLANIKIKKIAYLRYTNQLEDLEVYSPVEFARSPANIDKLLNAFETLYSKVYAAVATYREAGFQILELGLEASSPKIKPRFEKRPAEGEKPASKAFKGQREVYVDGKWKTANLYEMSELKSGNMVDGLAIIEATSTTLPIPESGRVKVDPYGVLWCKW
jgi:acetone carboxylase, beta subunit